MSDIGHNGVAADELRQFVERIDVAGLIEAFDQVEVWRDIDGFPGYRVSSWGRVKGKRVEALKPGWSGRNGQYQIVSLCRGPETVTKRVAPLVVRAFIGPPPFEPALVAHNDGDPSNNRVSNLRWASALENQADSIRHGTRPRGSQVFGSVLKESDVEKIRIRLNAGERYPSIASSFGVSISTISLINKGRIWRHV